MSSRHPHTGFWQREAVTDEMRDVMLDVLLYDRNQMQHIVAVHDSLCRNYPTPKENSVSTPRDTFLDAINNTTTGRLAPNAAALVAGSAFPPKAPSTYNSVPGVAPTSAQVREQLAAVLNREKAEAIAEKNAQLVREAEAKEAAEHLAKLATLNNLSRLASATTLLLQDIRSELSKSTLDVQPRATYVTHFDDLQPLAKSLGYKLVKVGDKSSATIVQL